MAPDPTAPAGGGATQSLWLVFAPSGVPQPHTCRFTHDDAMQACFGRYESGRYPGEWWQHNLDEGWTCREIALSPPSGAGVAGLDEVERLLLAFRYSFADSLKEWAGDAEIAKSDAAWTALRATLARQVADLERLRAAEVPAELRVGFEVGMRAASCIVARMAGEHQTGTAVQGLLRAARRLSDRVDTDVEIAPDRGSRGRPEGGGEGGGK